MFQCTQRRADTLNLVGEGRVNRDLNTGIFTLVGGSIGWRDAAMRHLVEYREAGLIEDDPAFRSVDARRLQRLTVAGKYLFRRWVRGDGAESVVQHPDGFPGIAGILPEEMTTVTYQGPPVCTTDPSGARHNLIVVGGVDMADEVARVAIVGKSQQGEKILLDVSAAAADELAANLLAAAHRARKAR